MGDLQSIRTFMELKAEFGETIPNHVGLILDGNRRWIKRQGLSDTLKGHQVGYLTLKNLLYSFFEAGVKYLSIYALSSENVKKRSKAELSYLFKLLMRAVNDVIAEPLIHENKVNVNIIGRIEELPKSVQAAINQAKEATKDYSDLFINVCINYDGQEEIVDAVKKLIDSGVKAEEISKKTIKQAMYTRKFPEMDYLIRTGMEDGARISGFLLWDASYAEFKFRNELWPDYNKEMLLEDLKEYVTRNRRKGA